LTGEWEKNVTTLYPVGGPLGGKKKLSFTMEEDFAIKLFEDGVLLSEYVLTGLAEKLSGAWKEYNTTGPPKVVVNVNLEGSGLIEVKNPIATIEELYWVNVTREKKKDSNASNDSNGTDETSDINLDSSSEADANASSDESANKSDSANSTNKTSNASAIEYEVIQKQKKKKHEKKLTVKRMDYKPVPLSEEGIAEARKELDAVAKEEEEVLAAVGMKNELEAAIYGSRDKMELGEILKVSTEEQREEVVKLCTEYEEWMYEGSTSKTDFETRLNKLKDLLGPMEERALELEARPDVDDNVKEVVAKMHKFHDDLQKNKTWVNETKLEATLKKLTDFEEWWTKKQESQKGLPLHEAPAYTKAEVQESIKKLQKDWDKSMKAATKKPKEDKKTAKGSNATNASSGSSKESTKEEALPSDAKAVEAELKAVREKKAQAVEDEDFDKANELKQRETKLKAHLATLEKSEL
jgi:hypoxia up-regulated 1